MQTQQMFMVSGAFQMLVVQEKMGPAARPDFWKMPTGLVAPLPEGLDCDRVQVFFSVEFVCFGFRVLFLHF